MLMFFTLMADAARVIEIRLWMMALGTSTPAEMFLMVSEKMNAMEEAKAIIVKDSGTHFDPHIVQAFLATEGQFVTIRQRYAEPEPEPQPAALAA